VSCPAIGVGNALPRIQEDSMSLPIEERKVILGVDTHLDVHVAVLIDVVGRVIATHSVPTTAIGYEQLIKWAGSLGRLSRAGVEGTGTYGAGLDLWNPNHRRALPSILWALFFRHFNKVASVVVASLVVWYLLKK
jgi:hypothetical protein